MRTYIMYISHMISTQLLHIIFNYKCLVTDDVTNAQVGLSVI